MSDEDLRELERAWKDSRDPHAGIAYYRALARTIPDACPVCGHDEAVLVGARPVPLAQERGNRVACARCGIVFLHAMSEKIAKEMEERAGSIGVPFGPETPFAPEGWASSTWLTLNEGAQKWLIIINDTSYLDRGSLCLHFREAKGPTALRAIQCPATPFELAERIAGEAGFQCHALRDRVIIEDPRRHLYMIDFVAQSFFRHGTISIRAD